MRLFALIFSMIVLLDAEILNNIDSSIHKSKDFKFWLGLNFHGNNFEDELNYFGSFTDLATRIHASLVHELDENNSLVIGGLISQDFYKRTINDGLSDYDIVAFYNFEKEVDSHIFSSYFGIMPRVTQKLPFYTSLISQTYAFYNPNIKGMLFMYQSPYGISEALLDWYGGNMKRGFGSFDRVRFGMNHRYSAFDNLVIGGFEYLFNHQKDRDLLRNSSLSDSPTILDQMSYRAYIGSDLASFIGLKKAFISVAYLGNAERFRFANYYEEFDNLAGLEASVDVAYRFLGFNTSLYSGNAQMKSFGIYNTSVYNGLPYYNSTFNNINRIYLSFAPSKNIDFNFSYFLVFYKNSAVSNTTNFLHQAILSINIRSKEITF